MYKKTLLIDLDGVLNEYNGKFDENFIPNMKDGAKEFLENLYETYNLKLFTTRNRLLAAKWLINNKLDMYFTDITNVKEPSYLHIDDRCVNFDGDFQKTISDINNFKPYWKE